MPPKKVVSNKENVEMKINSKTLEEHNVTELREMLSKLNMDPKGRKADLISRIQR